MIYTKAILAPNPLKDKWNLGTIHKGLPGVKATLPTSRYSDDIFSRLIKGAFSSVLIRVALACLVLRLSPVNDVFLAPHWTIAAPPLFSTTIAPLRATSAPGRC